MRTLATVAIGTLAIFGAQSSANAQDGEWFAELEGRSASEMGDILLGEREHRAIVEIVEPSQVMIPPGTRRYALKERPERIGDGCHRTLWVVSVRVSDGFSVADAIPHRQVALAPDDPCEFAEYTTLADNIPDDQGLVHLRTARDLYRTDRHLKCRDHTASELCRTDDFLRLQLRLYLTPTYIAREGDESVVSYHEPFTEARIPDDPGQAIAIERRVPAPF